MKKERLARALELVDDDLLEKAAPKRKKKEAGFKWGKLIAVACLALLLGGSIWMSIPYATTPPTVVEYQDSEYYDVIQKLNQACFVPPSYKNRFDKYILSLFEGCTAEDGMTDIVGAAPGNNAVEDTYREVTDNQVEGVIEADRIKRTDTHIFYLDGDTLRAYSIAGEASVQVGAYKAAVSDTWSLGGTASDHGEDVIYLSQNGKLLTWIDTGYHLSNKQTYTYVISLDVSDPTAIKQLGRVRMSGKYLSSRTVNGELLLITQFAVKNNVDFSNKIEFLPYFDNGNETTFVAAEDIVCPDVLSTTRYTVACKLDAMTLALKGSAAFLSYSSELYVNEQHLFATRSYTEEFREGNTVFERSMTEIYRIFHAGDGLEKNGSVTIEGSVKNQYSMDAFNGVLRVVTTTRVIPQRIALSDGENVLLDVDISSATNANLYCIDIESGAIVAQVIGFAPAGETVEAVRFNGNQAYVCTAVVVTSTDPVFFFDLSDLSNITYKDTGVIEGYSTSLVDFGNGYLLGIGVGSGSNTLKIEIFEQTETGVRSVCKYELEDVSYATDYKAYYIDRERGLVGLGVYHNDGRDARERYILLCFDGYDLNKMLDEPLKGTALYQRGILVESFFYLFGKQDFAVKQIIQ